MHKFTLVSLFIGCGIAAPAPQAGPGVFVTPDCDPDYTISSQIPVTGDLVTGDYTVGGGGPLNVGSTYSVGVTVTVGAGISVSKIAGLDLSASVSKTTTKAQSQGAGGTCPPGPWKCALAIFPEFLEVSGDKINNQDQNCPDKPPKEQYTVRYPVEGDSGGVKSRVEVCACKNYEHWADNGAPSIVCDGCAL